VLYLNNNGAGTINPVIDCRFTNAGNTVELERANLTPVGASQRVGLTSRPANQLVRRSRRVSAGIAVIAVTPAFLLG
jgi:hypothetical protein